MRKFISFILFFSLCAFAGVKPEFQAFAANFLDLKDAENGYHEFTLRVNVAPWAFVYTGKVLTPNGDPDALMDALADDELYEVIAYIPAPVQGSDGSEYQAGVFDIMIYYTDGDEDLQATIRDAKVQLLAPIAGDSWAQNAFNDAQTAKGIGVWKDAAYVSAITDASADPMDKTKVYASKRAAKKAAAAAALATSNAQTTTSTTAATTATATKRSSATSRTSSAQTTSTPAVTTASTASGCNDPNMTPRERKRCALLAKQGGSGSTTTSSTTSTTTATSTSTVTTSTASKCDDPNMTPRERKRCALQNR